MLLPVDDRAATRAHGVFDVLYLKHFKIINLDQHVGRLFKSAESASIVPPFNQQQTKDIII
jgi:branched-subunit amino acid aminotransferase/4-amino-4-deoxychorismate lyase